MINAHPAFTMFEASKSAILLIDHQVGTMQLVKNLPIDRVKRFSLALAKTAVALDMPLVLTSSQEDRIQGPLLPELQEIAPEAYAKRVKRAGVADAWSDLNFKRAVEATGRKQLVMAGITTDVCLVFPAINAMRDGYAVQCVMDASGSPYELSEETSRQRMQAAGVVLTAMPTVIAELVRDWSTPAAAKLLPVLFGDILPPVLR
jgi:nicotinamidase-related amidase